MTPTNMLRKTNAPSQTQDTMNVVTTTLGSPDACRRSQIAEIR
jgi:hypothetical protein